MRLTVSASAYTPNSLQCKCPMTRSSPSAPLRCIEPNLFELVATASAAAERIAWTRKYILISQVPLVISRLARCVQRLLHMDAEPSRRAACCNAERDVKRHDAAPAHRCPQSGNMGL